MAVRADAGAAWLQQFAKNPFARLARSLRLPVVPTDFHNPLSASRRSRVGDVASALDEVERASTVATRINDCSVADVVRGLDVGDPAAMQWALDADVVLETGAALEDTSARWFFREDGVGNDDHWLPDGYGAIVDHLALELDIRTDTPVMSVSWESTGVTVTTADGDEVGADRCVCSVPLSLLQRDEPALHPGLPERHRRALSRLGMGVVEKVVLRFEDRWWPTPPAGYFRWYDTPSSWCEWVDLTDGCGAPVVAGLIAHDAVSRHHHGRTDVEVAMSAATALHEWAEAIVVQT